MGYTAHTTSNPNGNQQVNVHPKQELTSFNANKLFQGLLQEGVYNAEVTGPVYSDPNYVFTIKAGTTLVFSKEHDNLPVIGKITLQEDAVVSFNESILEGFSTESFFLVATWVYDLNVPSSVYCDFILLESTELSGLDGIESNKDLIIAEFLNHTQAIGQSGTTYKIAYQRGINRNFFNHLYEINNNFPVTFNEFGTSIIVGTGNCILGDTYIHNKLTLEAATGNIWPLALTPPDGSTYKQIDILRIVNQSPSSSDQIVDLKWESFLKLSAGFTNIREFIDGYDFILEDIGYTVLYSVRDRLDLADTSPIWPQDCLIVNPLTPQLGIVEKTSRLKLPVY